MLRSQICAERLIFIRFTANSVWRKCGAFGKIVAMLNRAKLPDNIDDLKALLSAQLDETQALREAHRTLNEEHQVLRVERDLLRQEMIGRASCRVRVCEYV